MMEMALHILDEALPMLYSDSDSSAIICHLFLYILLQEAGRWLEKSRAEANTATTGASTNKLPS